MNIAVILKQVPDLAEELEIADSGAELDPDEISWVLNEFDDHALEEALQLKEATGGTVTAVALGGEDVADALYTALAKGADTALKVGDFETPPATHAAARTLAGVLGGRGFDLILTGVQAIDDVDGWTAPVVAGYLGVPHVSVVTHIAPADGGVTVNQEYAGGVVAELDVHTPAVLGVQAARAVPRYAPVSKVRQAMQTSTIEEVDAEAAAGTGVTVRRLFAPEAGGHAEMLSGGADAVAERLVEILKERGLVG
ncbi:MAG: electron transfer flavoprotein subunit beta/FixA family protein [Gemmatimonadetes bacterium]|nr:electron transfer flavoprotein subunit beta/FixA family protein [Gemmatimonadota bacterium]